MRKPAVVVTSHDLADLGHRRNKGPTRGPTSAIGSICAAAFIGLLATTDHALAVAGGDDCSGFKSAVCFVNGQKGQTICRPNTNNPVQCVVSTPPPRPGPPPPPPSPDVLTQHNDNSRTGAQLDETVLTPNNVGPKTFGRLYERHVEGQVIAQPLYVSNLAIPNLGVRNVVYVATRENMVYAFDADDTDPDPGGLIWSKPLKSNPAGSVPKMCPETIGPMGITSTPVIDRATGTMYVVGRNANGTIWLHALDITTGDPKAGTPGSVRITGGYSDVSFESVELNRAGLLLVNGAIIIGFSALNCDAAVTPGWHGWVQAYRASDLQLVGTFATTSKSPGWGGGVWASGKGIVADTSGNIYFETGNGLVNAGLSGKGSCSGVTDFGESFVKLKLGPPPSYGLTCASYYTVSNWKALNAGDTDLGSSGPVLLPGNLLVGGGKEGKLYTLDPGTMAIKQYDTDHGSDGFQAFINTWHNDHNQPECRTPGSVLGTRCWMPPERYQDDEHNGPNIHSGVIYWNGRLYGMPEKDYLAGFNYDPSAGTLDLSRDSPNTYFSTVRAPDGMPGGAISLSANGSGAGIIWASIPKYDGQTQNVPGRLVAFRATPQPGTTTLDELWRDDDDIGFAKFNPPTIAGGKVFRPTFADKLIVYGLYPPDSPAPSPRCYTIDQVYENFSRENGFLGNALVSIGPGSPTPRFVTHREYQGGAIDWTSQTCGHEVHGLLIPWHAVADPTKGIYAEWKALGLSSGFLGHPVTDETATPDGIGRYNHFQNGSIYWSPTTGAHEVHGAIRSEWARRGWEQSSLGYPISDETDDPDGNGRVSVFEHGAIHWDRVKGTTFVKPDQIDTNALLGPQEASAYRWSKNVLGIGSQLPPQANPAMCQASCADQQNCKAWTYEAPTSSKPPQCWIWYGIPIIAAHNPCCTSGLKVSVQPDNMTPMRDNGDRDQPGSTVFYSFPLPVKDPRLCQGECALNGTCRAWRHQADPDITKPDWCYLKSNQVTPVQDQCCNAGWKTK
jgi:LGFP repeat/PAN domain